MNTMQNYLCYTALLPSIALTLACSAATAPAAPPALAVAPCDVACDVADTGGSNTAWLHSQNGHLFTDSGTAWESRGAASLELQTWLCGGAVGDAELERRVDTLLKD